MFPRHSNYGFRYLLDGLSKLILYFKWIIKRKEELVKFTYFYLTAKRNEFNSLSVFVPMWHYRPKEWADFDASYINRSAFIL